jgi:outer membrane protein assembly factor BamB
MRASLKAVATSLALVACVPDERLPGERIPVRTSAAITLEIDGSAPTALPQQRINSEWTHPGGNSRQVLSNPTLPNDLTRIWSARVGAPLRPGEPVNEPIFAEDKIFTLAGNGVLAATTSEGRVLWTVRIVPEDESSAAAFGGGIAYDAGRLFVASGFGELRAVAPDTGETLWAERFNAPLRAAPAVDDNRIVIRDAADVAYGIEAETGRRIWQIQGAVGPASSAVTASPAISDGLALIPFSSGELLAVTTVTGQQQWGLSVGGGRRELARGIITDISGGPVVAGRNVYVANQTGTILALDGVATERLWQLENGAQDKIAVSESSLYLMTDRAVLLRISRSTGQVIWARAFDQRMNDQDETPIVYHGPILAGGRAIIATSAGDVIEVAPEDGSELRRFSVEKGLAAAPIVAQETLYLLSRDGVLFAYQ